MDWNERLENHGVACMAAAGGGARVTRLGGAMLVVNPHVAGSAFNFISLRRCDPQRLDAILEMGSALLAGEGRPPALLLAPVAGDMKALGAALQSLGWRCKARQVVLVRNLHQMSLVEEAGPLVTKVGEADLPRWGETLTRAYEVDPVAGEAIRTGWSALLRNPGDGCKAGFYLAWWDGETVGTGLYWGQGEIAGLYCGAVLPTHRKRGVERATLVRRLADAARAGFSWATLQTEQGSPVEHLCVDRLGFEMAYERELWLPNTQRLSPSLCTFCG